MRNIAAVTSYQYAPRNAAAFAEAVDRFVEAVREEEFGSGGLRTFAFYRQQSIVGASFCMAQFHGEGFELHAKNDRVRKALGDVEALLCRPAERKLYDPVLVWGAGEPIDGAPPRPADMDPAQDVGVLFEFTIEPKDDAETEAIMREIFDKVAKHEVPTGDVRSYAIYRDINVIGRWFMFEHFTSRGSAMHAANPDMMASGRKSAGVMTGPYSRTILVPANVNGCGEPLR